jgi:uncharacterized protein (DUF302 family)
MAHIPLALFVLTALATPTAAQQSGEKSAEEPIEGAEQAAASDLVIKKSPHSVDVTVGRLEAGLEKRSIKIIAKVDHRENAAMVKKNLRPTILLIFGNPRLGTPLIEEAPTLAVDLPMRVVVWREEKSGQTMLAYTDAEALGRRHGITANAARIERMKKALDRLTEEAIKK